MCEHASQSRGSMAACTVNKGKLTHTDLCFPGPVDALWQFFIELQMKAGIDNRSWTNHRHVSSWRASVPRLHNTGGRPVPASANPPLLLFHFRCRRDCCAGLKLLRALQCYIPLDFSRGVGWMEGEKLQEHSGFALRDFSRDLECGRSRLLVNGYDHTLGIVTSLDARSTRPCDKRSWG